MTQILHETFPVSSLRADNSVASQKRRHSTRQIKPVLMSAGGGNAKRLSSLRPSPSQAGMQSKPRLILKNHRLPRPQILKFFLTPGENASLLPPELEDMYNRPVLSDIPVGVSRSGLAALSVSNRTGALSVRLGWGPPHEPGLGQNLGAIALNAVPLPAQSAASTGMGALVSACSLMPSTLPCLPPGSNGSSSYASAQKPGPSSQAAALRRSREGRQSSTSTTPRGGPWQRPPGFPGSPPDDGCRQAPHLQFKIDWSKL